MKFFGSFDVEVLGVIYEDKMIEPPTVEKTVPEFIAGIEKPSETQVVLANTDGIITTLQKDKKLKGKRVTLKERYESGVLVENIARLSGIINSSEIDIQAKLNITPYDLSAFVKPFPVTKITEDDFPGAIDLGFVIPYIAGSAKRVPLSCIKADDATPLYQYCVGGGTCIVDAVYRDGLKLPTHATGTAQTGSTSTTIKLASGDTKDDDYYNFLYVYITGGTGAGQVRKITDYVKSTKVATVTPSWTTTPTSSSTYKILEYTVLQANTVVTNSFYTYIEFSIIQRERTGGAIFNRNRMSADVTRTEVGGVDPTLNPADWLKGILFTEFLYEFDLTAFNAAKTAIDAIGNLEVGGAIVEQRALIDVINELCLIGRMNLSIDANKKFIVRVDALQDTYVGKFASNDNIVSYEPIRDIALSELWKSLQIEYRKNCDVNEFSLITSKHIISSEGMNEEIMQFPLINNKTTADKVCNYLSKRKKALDNTMRITLGFDARNIKNGDLIALDIPQIGRTDICEIVGESHKGELHTFNTIRYDTDIFTYTAGTLPADPTNPGDDAVKTPPAAVTSLGVNWDSFTDNDAAILSWTNPTTNFAYCKVTHQRSGDAEIEYGRVIGTVCKISGLLKAASHTFRVTTYNHWDIQGGLASVTATSP